MFVAGACSRSDGETSVDGDMVAVSRVGLSLGDSEGALPTVTRAVSGFVVNTSDDPTNSLTEKEAWNLDLTIYKGSNPYEDGYGEFEYDGSGYWVTKDGSTIYMPHYEMQNIQAVLYPTGWTTGQQIATDQRQESVLILQDILEQDGSPTYQTVPAHYLEVKMRHAYSMIDFVLADVNPADLYEVTVEAGGNTYQPYQVTASTEQEYLVILPLGITNPVIHVTTNGGAKYSKELDITQTLVNTCYYVKLYGVELILESITVSNWTYGEAVGGDYSSVTSYPTFRGPVGVTVTIYYDSDVSQTITFNEKGEAVAKPAGRTITAVETTDGIYSLPNPYTIRTQIVDLTNFIDEI